MWKATMSSANELQKMLEEFPAQIEMNKLRSFTRVSAWSVGCLSLMLILSSPVCAQSQPSLQQMRAMLPMISAKLDANPKDANLLYSRAAICQQLGDLQGALTDSTAAISVDPNFMYAYNIRFVVYMQLKDFTKALGDAQQLIRIQPDANAYCGRGNAYISLNDYTRATQDFASAIKVKAGCGEAYDGLGEIAYKLKRYQDAVGYSSRAISLDPTIYDAYYFRGKAYEGLGKSQLAQRDLEVAKSHGYKPGEVFIQMKNP
jgi:tetratricopeptide (TPR) repeat protein